MALVVLLGAALFIVKVLHSPAGFTLHDELATWRQVWDLLAAATCSPKTRWSAATPAFPG